MKWNRDIGVVGYGPECGRIVTVGGLRLTPPYIFLIYRNLGNLTGYHPPTYLCRSKVDLYSTAPSMAGTVSPCARLTEFFHI